MIFHGKAQGPAGGGHSLEVAVPAGSVAENRPSSTVWFAPVRDPEGRTAAFCAPQGEATYCFSFMMKFENVLEGKFPSRTVRKVIEGTDAAGGPFFKDLLRVTGTRDWQQYSLELEPGTDFPVNPRSFRIGLGNRGGTGTFWLDQVQLERHPRATPFTPSVRTTQAAKAQP
jgi:hypothetical protein